VQAELWGLGDLCRRPSVCRGGDGLQQFILIIVEFQRVAACHQHRETSGEAKIEKASAAGLRTGVKVGAATKTDAEPGQTPLGLCHALPCELEGHRANGGPRFLATIGEGKNRVTATHGIRAPAAAQLLAIIDWSPAQIPESMAKHFGSHVAATNEKGNAVKAAPTTSAKRHERTAQAGAPFWGTDLYCFVHSRTLRPRFAVLWEAANLTLARQFKLCQ